VTIWGDKPIAAAKSARLAASTRHNASTINRR
jgi:hypothetical protein